MFVASTVTALLSKECVKHLLNSKLKFKNLLAHDTSFSWYCHCEKRFSPYFDQENDLMCCTDPRELVEKFEML